MRRDTKAKALEGHLHAARAEVQTLTQQLCNIKEKLDMLTDINQHSSKSSSIQQICTFIKTLYIAICTWMISDNNRTHMEHNSETSSLRAHNRMFKCVCDDVTCLFLKDLSFRFPLLCASLTF